MSLEREYVIASIFHLHITAGQRSANFPEPSSAPTDSRSSDIRPLSVPSMPPPRPQLRPPLHAPAEGSKMIGTKPRTLQGAHQTRKCRKSCKTLVTILSNYINAQVKALANVKPCAKFTTTTTFPTFSAPQSRKSRSPNSKKRPPRRASASAVASQPALTDLNHA